MDELRKFVRVLQNDMYESAYEFETLEGVKPEHRAAVAMLDACAARQLRGIGYVVRISRTDVYMLDKTYMVRK